MRDAVSVLFSELKNYHCSAQEIEPPQYLDLHVMCGVWLPMSIAVAEKISDRFQRRICEAKSSSILSNPYACKLHFKWSFD